MRLGCNQELLFVAKAVTGVKTSMSIVWVAGPAFACFSNTSVFDCQTSVIPHPDIACWTEVAAYTLASVVFPCEARTTGVAAWLTKAAWSNMFVLEGQSCKSMRKACASSRSTACISMLRRLARQRAALVALWHRSFSSCCEISPDVLLKHWVRLMKK